MQAQQPNDEELRRLYIEEGLSLNEVAARVGYGRSTVARHLTALGVELRSKGRPRGAMQVFVDEKRLRQLYEREGMGVHAVADELQVSWSVVVHALDRLGISRHESGGSRRPAQSPREVARGPAPD